MPQHRARSTSVAGVFTSTDHKVTGRLYLAGGLLGLVAAVVINVLIGVERLDGADTVLDVEVLPQLVDAQRVGLVFATLLPLAMAGCIAAVPLQLGARSIAFPRLASTGFWMWFGGAILTTFALLNNGGTLGGDADAVGSVHRRHRPDGRRPHRQRRLGRHVDPHHSGTRDDDASHPAVLLVGAGLLARRSSS